MAAQREIKFRAWDGEQMFYPENHTHISIFQGKGRIPWGLYANMGGSRITDGQYGGALMQFTGLLDKNGKEIYEGDRVRLNLSMGGTVTGEVVMRDGCYTVRLDEPIKDPDGYLRKSDYVKVYVGNHAIAVIGNIHEHPETLTT